VATIREQLTQEGFTDQEAEAIFRRAAELQSQAEQLDARLPRVVLDESAAAVGIPREFVEQAIQQVQAERTAQAMRRTARQRGAPWPSVWRCSSHSLRYSATTPSIPVSQTLRRPRRNSTTSPAPP
jgi:hypothetical protein